MVGDEFSIKETELKRVVAFDNIPTNMAAKLIEDVGNICDRILS